MYSLFVQIGEDGTTTNMVIIKIVFPRRSHLMMTPLRLQFTSIIRDHRYRGYMSSSSQFDVFMNLNYESVITVTKIIVEIGSSGYLNMSVKSLKLSYD